MLTSTLLLRNCFFFFFFWVKQMALNRTIPMSLSRQTTVMEMKPVRVIRAVANIKCFVLIFLNLLSCSFFTNESPVHPSFGEAPFINYPVLSLQNINCFFFYLSNHKCPKCVLLGATLLDLAIENASFGRQCDICCYDKVRRNKISMRRIIK